MKSPKFKPRFGFRPGIYLTILAASVLLLVLAALLVLPGLVNNGTVVSFTSDPSGAAVYVDDIYMGSTPFSAFIDKGNRVVRMEKPFFSDRETTHEIGGRVFFSLFAKRKGELHEKLPLSDEQGYLSWRLQDIYNWSLVTNFTSSYQYPNTAQAAAEDLAGLGPSVYADEFSSLLPYLASSSPVEADIREAFAQFGSPAASEALRLLDQGIPETPIYEAVLKGHFVLDDLDMTFAQYEAEGLGVFSISSRLVTGDLFREFSEAVPQWSKENKDELISRGLADDTYLQSPGRTALHISFYASQAFAAWITEHIDGYSAYIPDELHLLSAAEAGGLEHAGSMWQWSASPFYAGYMKPTELNHKLLDYEPNRVLLMDASGSTARGALPPWACSPVTGMRIMLIKD